MYAVYGWTHLGKRVLGLAACWTALVMSVSCAWAATYYVDAEKGSDVNVGTSRSAPWRTLEKVSAGRFQPGDSILLHCGSRWTGQLAMRSSGIEGRPIRIDSYDHGPMPRIDGEGKVEDALRLVNVEQIEVRHIEITNHGEQEAARRGVRIDAVEIGTLHHIVVADLFVHDVNGGKVRKDNGGILFRTIGVKTPSRFDDLRIERNLVWRVDRSAIVAESNQLSRSHRWYPSLHVVIRDNLAEDIGGDGIVPWATDGVLVEHNIVLHANQRAGSYNAGIWPWSTDNSLFVLNEAAFTHSTLDGEGFDSDYNSRNTHFFYNYSHDNDGGFMLICTPGKRNSDENIGNIGTVIEHNISRNDHARVFNLSAAEHTRVAHNVIYTPPGEDVQVLLVSNWDGWARDAEFEDNTFHVAGAGRYGHEVKGSGDGTVEIAPGWGPAEGIRFEGNRYFGRNENRPQDANAAIDPHDHPERLDWQEPVFDLEHFDTAHPSEFPAFIKQHRRWLVRLFTRQFEQKPQLPIRSDAGYFSSHAKGEEGRG